MAKLEHAGIALLIFLADQTLLGGLRAQTLDPMEVLERMRAAYTSVRDYTLQLHKEERIKEVRDGNVRFLLVVEDADVRFRKRGDVASDQYQRDIYFHKGCFWGCPAIYRDGFNDGKIDVRKGPDVVPRNPLAMKDQHHAITSLDLGRTISVILDNVSRAVRADSATVEYQGQERIEGRDAHKVSVLMQGRSSSYAVRTGDTLWTIADETGQDMYVILYANARITGPDDLSTGQSIVIPEYYGQRLVVWVGVEQSLPLKLEVYDAQGALYERYVHGDLQVNVSLSDDHFR